VQVDIGSLRKAASFAIATADGMRDRERKKTCSVWIDVEVIKAATSWTLADNVSRNTARALALSADCTPVLVVFPWGRPPG
jgi:hypothetical protein